MKKGFLAQRATTPTATTPTKAQGYEVKKEGQENKRVEPIEELLKYLRGVKDEGFEQLDEVLHQTLGRFGDMLLKVGALEKDSLLLRERQQYDGLQVLVFSSDQHRQGGQWHCLPRSYAPAMQELSRLMNLATVEVRMLPDGHLLDDESWLQVSHGTWLEVHMPSTAAVAPMSEAWPAPRCKKLLGALPDSTWPQALQAVGAAVVRGAPLLRAARRWSLERFLQEAPAERSEFSVYRASEASRCFRYAGEGHDFELREEDGCAERLMMSLEDFAERRAAADGYAYYLWLAMVTWSRAPGGAWCCGAARTASRASIWVRWWTRTWRSRRPGKGCRSCRRRAAGATFSRLRWGFKLRHDRLNASTLHIGGLNITC